MKLLLLQAMLLACFPFIALGQNSIPGKDSSSAEKRVNTLKPYEEVITNRAITRNGLLKVHYLNEKYFFEIRDSLLNRDILIVNRIEQAAAGTRAAGFGDVGDELTENVVQFYKGSGNKIYLRRILNAPWSTYSKDTGVNGLAKANMRSNLQSIVASFDIQAFSPDKKGIVIDVTDYLNSDNDIFFFDLAEKSMLTLTVLQRDKSYIVDVQSYPLNVEIHTLKTYLRSTGEYLSYVLNSSIVMLPQQPMTIRYADSRVGYFTVDHPNDLDFDPQGITNVSFVNRWRLEPKPEDVDKYNRGELVEPRKPIIFYIDPATPQKWVPYLIQGVNDWQAAFEQAGFKNAVYGMEAPVNDSTWSLEDARHNAIVYKPSPIKNASGPNVHDPRSGEILESHINWYHNVMRLIHDWYFVQAGAIDPRARKTEFDDSLMGELIRFVSSHEIGHALGLMHNFGSSSTVPVDSLRSKRWVEANGICPSIMDYARFNYVAQPEDSISEKGIFPRIGEYDKWAIEWGYRVFPHSKSSNEKKMLSKWVTRKLIANKRLWYGSQALSYDPRCQSEDLGDDAMKASKYGIQNLKRIESNLLTWLYKEGDDYANVYRMQENVVNQFKLYLFHVVANIGGVMRTEKTMDQKGGIISFTPKEKQRRAIRFLQAEIFTTPTWILNKTLFSMTGRGGIYQLSELQMKVIEALLSGETFKNLLFFEDNDSTEAYNIDDLLTDLERGIFSEINSYKKVNIYRRNLQAIYINQLLADFKPSKEDQSLAQLSNSRMAIISIIYGHLRRLLESFDKALPNFHDHHSKDYLVYMRDRLKKGISLKE